MTMSGGEPPGPVTLPNVPHQVRVSHHLIASFLCIALVFYLGILSFHSTCIFAPLCSPPVPSD